MDTVVKMQVVTAIIIQVLMPTGFRLLSRSNPIIPPNNAANNNFIQADR